MNDGPRQPPDKDFLTPPAVARELGVSRPTVVRLIKSGALSATQTAGGHYRISREDLERYAAAERQVLVRPHAGKVRLLVVDDDLDFGATFQDFFEDSDVFDVLYVESGFQAGMQVLAFEPDIILLDLDMPGLSGRDVRNNLAKIPGQRFIPTIACSGVVGADQGPALIHEGFDDFISKPFRLEQLAERLEPWFPAAGPRGE
ncbi:MAG: response regulator [Deltaproteobacteria bacterium]|nr:response regulator [Deltaproteobacteria bacterium]